MSRLALIVSVIALAWMVGVASASACITEDASANGAGAEKSAPVHPGSPMEYSVSGLDAGAMYQVFVQGRAVTGRRPADGSRQDRDTFVLPSYGPAPRELRVQVYIDHARAGTGHEGPDTWTLGGGTLNYVPRAAPAPQEQPTPTKPAGATPTPPGQAAAPISASTPPANTGPAGSRPTGSRPRHAPRPNRSTGRARVPTKTRVTEPVRTARPRPAAPSPRVPATPRRAVVAPRLAAHAAGARRLQMAPHRARPIARVLPDARGDANLPAVAVGAPQTSEAQPRTDATWIVVALTVLTLLAAGGLGWVSLRARRDPEPDQTSGTALELEAELQEMIAEHHARELTHRESARVAGPPG